MSEKFDYPTREKTTWSIDMFEHARSLYNLSRTPAELRRTASHEALRIYGDTQLCRSLHDLSAYYAQLQHIKLLCHSGGDEINPAIEEADQRKLRMNAFMYGAGVMVDISVPTFSKAQRQRVYDYQFGLHVGKYEDPSMEDYATLDAVEYLIDSIGDTESHDDTKKIFRIGQAMFADQIDEVRPAVELSFKHGVLVTAYCVRDAVIE